MKFAAIDIGSNAVRLLFSNVLEEKETVVFKAETLIRVPLRLGHDAFSTQLISPEKAEDLLKTMIAFRNLIDVHKALDYMACATSAMREAKNGEELIQKIKQKAEIDIQIIHGQKEAEIIYANQIAEQLNPEECYLYVDVGGGSTELTLFANQDRVASQSFNIGSVRLLENQPVEAEFDRLKFWIHDNVTRPIYLPLSGIGSGGNINSLFKLSKKKEGKPLTYKGIRTLYQNLQSYSLEERIKILGLKPDRADVIIPATEIYLSVMRLAHIDKIFVPQIGLVDGIIHLLYEKHTQKKVPKTARSTRSNLNRF
ncbi:MAG: exopolyphosphatase [Planctomycetota bacterium]